MATRKPKVKITEPVVGDSLAAMLGMDETIAPTFEPYKQTKISPFDFLNSITYNKENLIVDETTEAQYLPFMVNTGLSQFQDTVMMANYMNCRPHVTNKGQFLFLINTITKRNRFEKWVKIEPVDNLDLVMEYYNFSRNKALSALKILTDKNIDYIKHKMRKGGQDGQTS